MSRRFKRLIQRGLAVAPWVAGLVCSLCAGQAAGEIVINELMYHPYEPYPYPYYTNNTEYIEIFNAGTTNVDLSDYRLDSGVDFSFPYGRTIGPGEYAVICENLHQFTNAYPTVTNIIGQFSGGLANGGERVTLSRLVNGEWITVDTIKYIDGGPSDGLNQSLELVHPGFAYLRDQYYGTWIASLTASGTPGMVNWQYNETPSPTVGNVRHDPPLPLPGSSVAITAHAAALSGETIASVVLSYRIDANPTNAWRQATMRDDGREGDAKAGDGIYTLYLPEANDPPMNNGAMYEFTITATDEHAREITMPAENTSDETVSPPYSYLIAFLDDEDFTGEYRTYHILMTRVNRYLLEYVRAENSKVLIDCTFITSDGEIFYNSGVRYRGNSSLKWPYNFRIEIPRGMDLDGSREWDFNYRRAMLQYLGLTVIEEAGNGCHGLNQELARLWLNETDKTTAPAETAGEFHNIYVKFEPVDNDLLSKYYDAPLGNIYRGQNGTYAGLQVGTIANYQSWYLSGINNSLTAWTELDSLCRLLTNDVSLYPTALTNLVDVRQWARTYGAHSAMSNGEGGFHCPRRTQGDDYYMYRRADTGQFVMYPWDLDEVIEHGVEGQVATNRSIWAYENNNTGSTADEVVSKFLFNRPIVSYYVGDVLDILQNVMSPKKMAPILDGMGSLMTPAYRQTLARDIESRRKFVLSEINTNLSVTVTGALRETNGVVFVNSAVISLTGTAPQNYTTGILVDGATNTTWNTRQNAWSTTSNVVLTAAYNTLTVRAVDAEGETLKSAVRTVIVKADNETHSGTITTDTLWDNPGGILTVTADVTIDSGATLTVAAGNTVLMDPGKRFVVNNGTLAIAGEAANTVRMLASDAESLWSVSAASGGTVTGQYAELTGGRIESDGGRVSFTESDLGSYAGGNGIVDINGGETVLHRCTVSDYDLMSFQNARITISECVLRNMDSCAANFVEATATVSRTTIEEADVGATGFQASQDALLTVTNTLFRNLAGKALRVGGVAASEQGVDGINHQNDGWVYVGSFAFQGDGTEKIMLNGGFGGSWVCADAIKLTGGTEDIVVDNEDGESFSHTGSWTLDVSGGEGGSHFRSVTPSDTATWLLPAFAPGTYSVYASIYHFSRASSMYTDASYTVYVNLPSTATASLGNSLIHGCGTALEVGVSSTSLNHHVTIADCSAGITGTNVSLHSAIHYETATNFPYGTPSVTYSDITAPGTNIVVGTGNMNRPPWFRDPDNGDYRLLSISPCIGTGMGGTDMGAAFPLGASPATPSALSASNTIVGSTGAVALAWADTSDNESWFDVERSQTGNGEWVLIASLPANSTSYTDATVGQNTVYSYRVRAGNARGVSFYSDTATVATLTDVAGKSLRITEIMYHPEDGSTGDDGDYEFLEISNLGDVPIDLSGFVINGIGNYMFPTGTILAAGDSLVLIRHEGAFTERYPAADYFGLYDGGLSNSGETLTIHDSKGGTVLSFTYSDWYPSTDGGGCSLVLVDPDGDLSSASSWRPSSTRHGTPGAPDPLPPYAQILINEVFTHTDEPFEDAVELFNAGTTAVDIANWYLSDNDADPAKYQITNATLVIPPGGYHVFYEGTSFNQGGGGFAFSELGDTVYLSSGDGTQITDYRASESFSAAANGVPFGRYVRSDGQTDFVAMTNQTFGVSAPGSVPEFRTGTGASNSYPLVGPVVINEIMYNPAAAGKEFVEILNMASTNVPLFSGTNCWEFDGAFEYVFPTNTWIAPGEHILVASIEPAIFRSIMGLTNTAITIFGPFDGNLANDGESIKLYRPGAVEANGLAPRIRVDRVKYDDDAPWPTAADNDGPSLERVSPVLYGNDPANWIAATIGGTPGEANNTAGLPSVAFAPAASSGIETNHTVNMTIALMPACASTVTVSYAVSGGTAANGSDYTFAPGTVVFWPYETTKTITLQVLDDAEPEVDEFVEIRLADLSAKARYGGSRVHRHTIIDSDATALAPPIITPLGTNSFTFAQSVSMSSHSVTNGAIYYTLNGKTPTRSDYLYATPFVLNATAKVKARTFLGTLNSSPVATALFLKQTPPSAVGIIERQIANGNDDAYQFRSGSMNLSGTSLVIGYTERTLENLATGLRFTNITIPQGATISNAYVQFTATGINEGNGGPFDIHAENADNSAAFASTANNIGPRERTSASVAWSPPNSWLADSSGPGQRTPDISSIIEEVISRPGWEPTNALSIIILSPQVDGYRKAYAYEGNTNKTAVLHVEFSLPGDGDEDNDGMLDVWEIQYFGKTNATLGGPQEDYDLDGMVNIDEYVAGTIPTDGLSVLKVSSAAPAPGQYVLYWSSASGRLYAVYRATNLMQSWQAAQPLTNNMPAAPGGTNVYNDSTAPEPSAFYRIGVRLPE